MVVFLKLKSRWEQALSFLWEELQQKPAEIGCPELRGGPVGFCAAAPCAVSEVPGCHLTSRLNGVFWLHVRLRGSSGPGAAPSDPGQGTCWPQSTGPGPEPGTPRTYCRTW